MTNQTEKIRGLSYGNGYPVMHMFQDATRVGFVCSVDFLENIKEGTVLLKAGKDYYSQFTITEVLDSYSVGDKYNKCCGFRDAVYMMCACTFNYISPLNCEVVKPELQTV